MDALSVEYWVVGGCDQHVIHVHHEPALSDFVLEYGVHHGLEGGGGVGEAKEHNRWFIQSFVCDEGGFPFITFLDAHIVIAPMDIKLGEEFLHPYSVN